MYIEFATSLSSLPVELRQQICSDSLKQYRLHLLFASYDSLVPLYVYLKYTVTCSVARRTMQWSHVGGIREPAIVWRIPVQGRQERQAMSGFLCGQRELCRRRREHGARPANLLGSLQHGSAAWGQRLQPVRYQPVPPHWALHAGSRYALSQYLPDFRHSLSTDWLSYAGERHLSSNT